MENDVRKFTIVKGIHMPFCNLHNNNYYIHPFTINDNRLDI